MTYVQFPYVVLTQLGRDLSDVGSRLSSKQHGATDCGGLGSDGQSRIQDAIGSFRDEWKTSISSLTEDIGNWGGLSKAIGDMVQQFDAQVGQALSPPGN
ncbi:MAG TPA: hypothetical protein VFX70_03470 [Mycobacteriales bacterium]|nr:hypothetical protein [Mycobacteriales bacterium]